MPNKKDQYAATPTAEEQEALDRRKRDMESRISPAAIGMPGMVDIAAPAPRGRFDHLFGSDDALAARGSALQAMFDKRRQTAERARTDSAAMARYNAMGNLLTSLVQPIGWTAGGGNGQTGGFQPYDSRAYLDAFNRAVKATEDLRNIGTLEDEYKFKLADEDYRRALSRDEEERRNKFSMDKLAAQYQQKLDLAQQKFEQDMQKEQAKAAARMEIAEFNASHRVVGRSSGGGKFTADERRKNELLKQFLVYAQKERDANREPLEYKDWLGTLGYSVQDATASAPTNPPVNPPVAPTADGGGIDIGL